MKNTKHMNVRVRDLPKWLRTVVEAFRKSYWDLRNPDIAWGMCYHASGEFTAFVRHHIKGTDVIRPKPIRIQSVIEDPFYSRFFTKNMRWHHVAKVGDIYIDWTARQFSRRLSFPRVWKHKTNRTSRDKRHEIRSLPQPMRGRY